VALLARLLCACTLRSKGRHGQLQPSLYIARENAIVQSSLPVQLHWSPRSSPLFLFSTKDPLSEHGRGAHKAEARP